LRKNGVSFVRESAGREHVAETYYNVSGFGDKEG
jgi:hypothetical protein